ncbi:DUF4184 family protein [Cellulomonas soli]
MASLVLGVLTHVAWDAFTHGDGLVVQHVAWLREPLVGSVPAARVLQHVSTAAGLVVLAVWGLRAATAWRRSGGRLALDRGRIVVAVGLVAAGAMGAVVGAAGSGDTGIEARLSAAAKDGGTVFLAAVVLAAALWWIVRLASPRRAPVRPR